MIVTALITGHRSGKGFGSPSGVVESTPARDCPGGFQVVTQMPVTVTRQGGVPDNTAVDDPTGVAPRTPSQADSFQEICTRTELARPDNGVASAESSRWDRAVIVALLTDPWVLVSTW